MTAYEVIAQIKALPLNERAKVIDFMQELDANREPVQIDDNSAFEAATRRVFDGHADLMRKLSQ